MDIKIIYEDDEFLVINKPAGLLSVGADNQRRRTREGRGQETAFSMMRGYVKRRNPREDLYIVHRLDRDTSGVLVFAKNPELQEALRYNWNNNVMKRQYIAVVHGALKPAEGMVKNYLIEDSRYRVSSTPDPNRGKLAITRYKTLATGNGMSLLDVDIATGRKNQIRVHLSELRHPVVGDREYGSKGSTLGRMCLHAQTLKLVHPFTRQLVTFSAPAPQEFAQLVHASL